VLVLIVTIAGLVKTMASSFGSWVHSSQEALIIRSVVGSPVANKSKSRVGRWLNLLHMWNINCAENARTPNEQKLVDAAVIFRTFL
jgi:predicted HAD superfamily phosphohydrolase YqeG